MSDIDTPPEGTIRVELNYDTETGVLDIKAPENYHFVLGVMRLAEAQIQFKLGNRAEEQMMAGTQMGRDGISIVRQMPDALKGN